MGDWQEVYQDSNGHRAEIVCAVLADMDMEPVLINKKDSSHHFGWVEVMVKRDYVLKALKVINEEIHFE